MSGMCVLRGGGTNGAERGQLHHRFLETTHPHPALKKEIKKRGGGEREKDYKKE